MSNYFNENSTADKFEYKEDRKINVLWNKNNKDKKKQEVFSKSYEIFWEIDKETYDEIFPNANTMITDNGTLKETCLSFNEYFLQIQSQ